MFVQPAPPVWDEPLSFQTHTVDVEIAPVDFSAFILEGDEPITYGITNLPVGLVLDVDTGIVTGTPTVVRGFEICTASATNDAGGPVNTDFTWAITAP